MCSNKSKGKLGVVYSTNPDYQYQQVDETPQQTLPQAQQRLRIRKECAGRGGKVATTVQGFIGNDADLKELAKLLKNKLGTGGSAKDGIIIIQGDCGEKLKNTLLSAGYTNTK